MVRISHHKSQRSRKHRDHSESEDEGNLRDRKPRAEEEEIRVSDQEKKKSSSKDNSNVSRGHGKRRNDDDRWNGSHRDDDRRIEKKSKNKGFDVLDLEKKSKTSSSRRRDGSSERNDEKRRSVKESGRRESSGSQYKDGKEKEKERERERGSEMDKKVQDSKYERSDDQAVKQGVEISELHDNMDKSEVEKEMDRCNRRRGGYSDKDRVNDRKVSDDRQASYSDNHSKNGSYNYGRCKKKYEENLDRGQRHHDDKRRDEHSSRTHTSERLESKHYRDENRLSESHNKKTKLQDSDPDGNHHGDDYNTKFKDMRGRKRSDEIEDQNDMKRRSAKEPREETAKNSSSSTTLDSRVDRVRQERSHIDKVDSSLSNSRTKNSPDTSVYAVKDQNRHSSRQPESTCKDSLSGDACCSVAVSRDYRTSSGSRDRMPESQSSEQAKVKDSIHSDVLMSESHHDWIPRSDAHTSPNQLTDKSPAMNERRLERSTARRNLDVEEGGKRSSSSRGGKEREYLAEKPDENGNSQEISKRDHVSLGPSSNHDAQLQGNSPGHLPPPPTPNRAGANSPSVLGSYEDETRIQNGDPKANPRYKRGRDASVGRGPATPWKSSTPTWPSPVANGFMTLQHRPPPFVHPVVPRFPAPTLFSGRPPMDLDNNSYHLHEIANRFPGLVPRPYGWHNLVDDHPPHLQMWDGNPNVFGNECDRNRLLMSRGWEMSTDNIWSGQDGNVSVEFLHVPQKEHECCRQALVDEAWVGQSGNHSYDERARSEQPIADGSGIKPPCDSSPAKQAVGAPSKSVSEKAPELFKIPSVKGISGKHSDDNVRYCNTYLSKLDVSPDLAQPDLYMQCLSLLDVADRCVTHNIPSQGWRKNNVESFRLLTKSRRDNSLVTTASDATFQRAMSLYRKQREGMKAGTSLAIPLCLQNNPPESKEGENLANTLLGDYMGEDQSTVSVVEGDAEKIRCDNKPVEAEETGCDKKLSDAVVFIQASEESEAKIVLECRENISRIHLSPQSTR